MLRAGVFVRHRLRWGVLGLTILLAAAVISSDADARGRRHRHHAAESYEPSYSSIVVDANSGAVMQATNADSPRHPASLTKIMTLYLLFERLEAGKIKMSTEMPVSAHAAAQSPSKLGLKPGQTIQVATAIRAIVTKSANDVAVVLAEALAGSEPEFAKWMTAKAHALGMTHTTYHNASGLPDDRQITTARDQAILGRAIQDRFPEYYRYFSTRTFAFRGKLIRNHNHLLGKVDGVDGIKTGYIHDSGFNIVVSVRRDGRHIIAVVFGGRTARARDARVRDLIDDNIDVAALKRTAPAVVEARDSAKPRAKGGKNIVAAAAPARDREEPAPGSTDPIRPNPVKTVAMQVGTIRTASLFPLSTGSRRLIPVPTTSRAAAMAAAPERKPDPPPPPGAKPGVLGVLPAKLAAASDDAPVATGSAEIAAKVRSGGWMIQVGAFDDESEAKQRLVAAQDKAKHQLGRADPFTERVAKGDKSLYRARFAGLDKDQARTACKRLKSSDIPCMLLKN
jgi:D-alanyl-D-alanine carboxypeptidase